MPDTSAAITTASKQLSVFTRDLHSSERSSTLPDTRDMPGTDTSSSCRSISVGLNNVTTGSRHTALEQAESRADAITGEAGSCCEQTIYYWRPAAHRQAPSNRFAK